MLWWREMYFVGWCCQKISFTTPSPNTFYQCSSSSVSSRSLCAENWTAHLADCAIRSKWTASKNSLVKCPINLVCQLSSWLWMGRLLGLPSPLSPLLHPPLFKWWIEAYVCITNPKDGPGWYATLPSSSYDFLSAIFVLSRKSRSLESREDPSAMSWGMGRTQPHTAVGVP